MAILRGTPEIHQSLEVATTQGLKQVSRPEQIGREDFGPIPLRVEGAKRRRMIDNIRPRCLDSATDACLITQVSRMGVVLSSQIGQAGRGRADQHMDLMAQCDQLSGQS